MDGTPPHKTTAPAEQLAALCRRAFGDQASIGAIVELEGASFNQVYRVSCAGQPDAILRLAPRDADSTDWHTAALMRREHSIQPFFAPLAELMPRTILVDFTHQLIDRDYMVQTLLEGERWEAVEPQLTAEEDAALWGQLGRILKTIHGIQGTRFGHPYPGRQYASWSETMVDRFLRISDDMVSAGLDQGDLMRVFAAIQRAPELLDEVTTPALLHGDLWLANLLVRRGRDGPTISGVLDAEQAWWGDPLMDWTLHMLPRDTSPRMEQCRAHFWQAYGRPEETPATRFRALVYQAYHASIAWASAVAAGDQQAAASASAELHAVAEQL